MAAATDQRLARLLRTCREEGFSPVRAVIEAGRIELEFGEVKPGGEAVTEADLRDWSKFR